MRAALLAAWLAAAAGSATADEPCRVPAALRPAVLNVQPGARPVVVVALGSSSTWGTGASTPARAYPAVLERLLAARWGTGRARVVNAGRLAVTAADDLRRLDGDVLARRPDIVLWQVGTNDVLRGRPTADILAEIDAGLQRLHAAGVAVALIGPQHLPGHARDAALAAFERDLAAFGARRGRPVLRRWAMMRAWAAEGGWPGGALIGADGLHLTDRSYGCLAERALDLLPAAPPD